MSLQGVLSDFGVADIFQLIAQQRKTGVLGIESSGRTLEVYFLDGAVVRARPAEVLPDAAIAEYLLRTGALSEPALADAQRHREETLESLAQVVVSTGILPQPELERVVRLVTYETIFELFLWEQGSFRFRAEDVQLEPGDQAVGAEMVLLDALRMRDEWAQIQTRLPDLNVVVVPVADAEEFRARRAAVEGACGLSEEEVERLFQLANGRSSARRIVDLSRLGTFLGAKGLAELLRSGLVRVERPVLRLAPEQRPSDTAPVRPIYPLGALALAAAIALALLALDPPSPPGRPIPVDALARARWELQLERTRVEERVALWATAEGRVSLGAPDPRLAAPQPDGYPYARPPEAGAAGAER